MTETEVRDIILNKLADAKDAHTAYPLLIEIDNRHTVDQALQEKPYAQAYIDFLAAEQADMADNPLVKQWGQLIVQAVFKEGTGTIEGAALRDYLRPLFSIKNFGGITFQAAELHRGQCIKGWEHLPILLNFWYFSTNT